MVLLEAGHNESADTWDPVFLAVASFTRVCRYDRAGLGRSDAPGSRGLRTGRDVVADLHGLLGAANERGATVLVGHSLGGAFARLYAAAYPDRTAGLVLVDAVHERELAGIDALLTSAQREAGAGMHPMSPEGLDIEAIHAELRRATTPLRIPVVVVARGRPLADDEMPPTWSAEQRRRREQLRVDLQADLARISSAGELVVARQSGHFVHHEEPSLVLEAIRKVVTAWRAGRNQP
jgi:pimeloyl-ACP methyl ester carboxylesterase